MNTENPISPELQARIDSIEDEKLRKDIIFLLSGPGNRIATNEEIFDNRVASYEKAKAQQALWRRWSDEEVLSFIEYFKREIPDDFAEYVRQERENNQIESELSWRVRRLADKWIPDLTYADNGNLVSKVRDHLQMQLRAESKGLP